MYMKKMVKGLLPGLWMRDNSIKLKYRFRLNIRKNLFMIRMEKLWNTFPREVARLEMSKIRLDITFSNIISCRMLN